MKRTIVITGGTSGIGMYTAIGVAREGAKIVVTGRDPQRGAKGVETIQRESGNNDISLALGDLSSLAQIRRLATDLRLAHPKIDVLVNNAGMLAASRELTADGIELDFAVNVIAPYLLTHELLPSLEAARPSRGINVTGGLSTPLDPENLEGERDFRGIVTYSRAKRALEAMSIRLAEELKPHGVFVNVVYPGGASTNMTRVVTPEYLPWPMKLAWPMIRRVLADDGGKGAAKASRSSVFAATSPDLANVSGQYYDTSSKRAQFHKSVLVPDNQRRVMQTIERYVASIQ